MNLRFKLILSDLIRKASDRSLLDEQTFVLKRKLSCGRWAYTKQSVDRQQHGFERRVQSLDELEKHKEELKVMEQMWMEELQPYGERGYHKR